MKHPELGCYGDGAFGHQHTREACAAVLQTYAQDNFTSRGRKVPPIYTNSRTGAVYTVKDCLRELRGEMSDDAEEEHLACEWLNEHAPFTGAEWGWVDGDFGLWPEERL